MGFLASLFFGFVPMLLFALFVYWLDRYEKEPKILLGAAFVWGAVVAAAGAFLINTLFGVGVFIATNSESATMLTTGALIAPIVEETLKGFAVLLVFLIFRNEFDSVLDGIIYAGITALGFAATENVYYIYTYGFQEGAWSGLFNMVFVRVILVGWQHPFYTAFIGIGLAIARLNRSCLLKGIAPLGGWTVGVILHSLHNTIANLAPGVAGYIFGSVLDWTGWFFMLVFIIIMTVREQRYLTRQLLEEVNLGVLSLQQYKTACSAWSQGGARFLSIFSGHYRETDRFYQLCGEISHKKEQYSKLGNELDNLNIIDRLRQELRTLSTRAGA